MRTLLKVIKYLAIYFVSFVLLSFAVSKFLGAQFQVYNYAEYTPLKELPRFWHAWSFFGRSYAYNVFIGITELTAGILILFDRTRLAGLLLAVGIYVNIIFIDVEFEVNNAIVHSTVEFIIICFLLLPYLPDL
ncbi:MAG TPA: hypothetical protein VFD44_05115, partial [Hanamia sp.]|nr:hypothetical protein [Hanamia sp.]